MRALTAATVALVSLSLLQMGTDGTWDVKAYTAEMRTRLLQQLQRASLLLPLRQVLTYLL